MFGCVKQLFFSYAQRVGFFYITYAADPPFYHSANVCGGTAILSRFPITSKEEIIFRDSVFSDSESTLGCIYSQITLSLKEPGTSSNVVETKLHLFTTHLQSTHFEMTKEEIALEIECR